MGFFRKDLIGLQHMSVDEINMLLNTAKAMESSVFDVNKGSDLLKGRTMANLFYEPSTRTRSSFELAGKHLGANVVNIGKDQSSIVKGESLADTGKTLEAMGTDLIVLRHPYSGAPELLGNQVSAKVINAGDGCHEHPTQALLDIYTLMSKFGNLHGLHVAIVGDISHSRVARSNIWGLTKLGAKVTVTGPPSMIPPGIEYLGVTVASSLDDILPTVDAVMMLRIQSERQNVKVIPSKREYYQDFGLTKERAQSMKDSSVIMHPGPVNQGTELSSQVMLEDKAVIEEQVTKGVIIRMALLYLLEEAEALTKGGLYYEQLGT